MKKRKRLPIKMLDAGAGSWEGPAVRLTRQLQKKNVPENDFFVHHTIWGQNCLFVHCYRVFGLF